MAVANLLSMGGHCSLDQKMSMKARQKRHRLGPADTWKLLLCTTNSRTTPKLGNQFMAHTRRVFSLPEVGEAGPRADGPNLSRRSRLIAEQVHLARLAR